MCGIIGYSGPLEAGNILLNGLSQLEYRGYDSAGIGYFDTASKVHVVKETGKVAKLKETLSSAGDGSHCGIGHTRWATHGGVSDVNAHPHRAGRITLIHNGIIENYHRLTQEFDLESSLLSQTDSEVAAWILDRFYDGDAQSAIRKLAECIVGSYAFCIMFDDRPGEIYAIRSVSPLVASYTPSGALIASDLTALIPYTKSYFVVPEGHIVKITGYKISVFNLDGEKTAPEMMEINWNTDAAMKNGFPHFMLKEIHEQPEAMKNTILPRMAKGLPDFTDDGIPDDIFAGCSQIHIGIPRQWTP